MSYTRNSRVYISRFSPRCQYFFYFFASTVSRPVGGPGSGRLSALGDQIAPPGIPRPGQLPVRPEAEVPLLGQVHMTPAAVRLHHVPLVGRSVQLPVHHHAVQLRLGTQQGKGQGQPLAVRPAPQQRVIGGGASRRVVCSGQSGQTRQTLLTLMPFSYRSTMEGQ